MAMKSASQLVHLDWPSQPMLAPSIVQFTPDQPIHITSTTLASQIGGQEELFTPQDGQALLRTSLKWPDAEEPMMELELSTLGRFPSGLWEPLTSNRPGIESPTRLIIPG